MTFLSPELLLGLLLIPVAIGFYLWTQRRRSRYAVRFTNLDLLANIAPRRPAWRRHVPPVLYLGAIAALLIGLARPTMVMPVPREDATILLAMDISGSMRATDVDPTRLDAAKAAAISFIDQIPDGVRVGVVSFASEANTLVAPTTDHAELKAAIDGLTGTRRDGDGRCPDAGPRHRRADPDRGRRRARRLRDPDSRARRPTRVPPRTSTPRRASRSSPRSCSRTAPTRSARPSRSMPRSGPRPSACRSTRSPWARPKGLIQVIDQNGQQVTLEVPPDTETLDQIAEITGGQSFDAPSAADLQAVYDNLESRVGYTEEVQEVTFLLVAAGLVLVVLGAGASALWFGRLP